MKNKFLRLALLFPLIISGCTMLDDFDLGTNNSSSNSSTSESSSDSSSHSGGSSSSSGSESSESSSSSSSSEEEQPPEPENTTTIEVYASNDIHGQIMPENNRTGLLKFATYFNEMGKHENTLLLDQGDTWQGSVYSNYNHGELLTDVMNYIHYDARSVGNHDFDWGVEYLTSNTARSYQGYSTPVLAGNVYDFNFATKQVGNIQQSNIGVKSVTYTLENGVKVGILGGIGRDQITSINSQYTQNIAFTDHISFIKNEATHLREDEGCDVVIASIHADQDDLINNNLRNYVDLVLCGHSHQNESSNEGELYYSQSNAYTGSFGHITLTYDFNKKDVTSTNVETIYANQVNNAVTKIDPTIQSIYDEYVNDCAEAANEVLANNVTGTFYYGKNNGYAEDIMAKAIFDQAVKEGYGDICVSYVNDARHALPYGSWTYADLYQSFPFDNKIYIAEITGSEFLHEIKYYNFIYRNPSFTEDTINTNQTYKIAVLDYLYFHTNSNRYYDYFSTTGGTSTITLKDNYRVILKNWLKENGYNSGKALNPSDYSLSLWAHDRTVFQS